MDNKIKVLYVDDEQINTLLFKMNFSKKYDVFIASNGNEGLSLLDNAPDIKVVISDMKMPGLNGIEFIKKARERYTQTKYYILTGFEVLPEIQEAIDNGLIIECFQKPFDVDRIESAIEN